MMILNCIQLFVFSCLFFCLFHSITGKSCSSEDVCTTFEGHGFPYTRNFHRSAEKQQSLTLAAAGMRKKKLFIIEVNVYTVGIYLSPNKEQDLKSKTTSKEIVSSTADSDEISAGIVLHFVRDVPTSKVVDAIVEALLDESSLLEGGEVYTKAVKELQGYLLAAIGEGGMKTNDEIEFAFYGGTGQHLAVSVRDQYQASLENALLRRKLLDIYTGAKAVAPAVYQILSEKYGP